MITFKTEFYSNIDMFDDVGLQLLEMMGHSASVPGAILAADVPAALANLKRALAAEQPAKLAPVAADENDEQPQSVSISNRAFPLIELLNAAATKKTDVMWAKTSEFISK
jgi:hypothetical protein